MDDVIRQLEEELKRLTEQASQAQRIWRDADDDRKAVERTIDILNRRRTQTPARANVNPSDLTGMTQEQAVIHIAERQGGVLRFGSAKRLLLSAGLIANPKNAATILYGLLQRSERFERIQRGEYRLVPIRLNLNRDLAWSTTADVADWLKPLTSDAEPKQEEAG